MYDVVYKKIYNEIKNNLVFWSKFIKAFLMELNIFFYIKMKILNTYSKLPSIPLFCGFVPKVHTFRRF